MSFKETIDKLPPKNAFTLGFVGGLLLVFALGFFLLLGYTISGNDLKLAKSNTSSARAAETDDAPSGEAPAPAPERRASGAPPEVTERDWVRGSDDAKITLIEYSDLECPFCKRFHPTMRQIVETYPNDVRWVYRHFPLSFHANAQKEAEASECAGELGGNDAFWMYVDAIFERTTSNGYGFAANALVPLARELGLDETKFKECLDTGKYTQYVKDQMNAGAAAGVSGTPGTFAVGPDGSSQLIPGALPFESVKAVVESLL